MMFDNFLIIGRFMFRIASIQGSGGHKQKDEKCKR